MTNIVVETTTLYDDETKRIVQVSVTDLEANVPYSQSVSVEKTVERSSAKPGDVVVRQRLNSYNKPVYILQATDDDILNKQNALISKAIRTLGLRLVPGDIIDECMDLVLETQKKKDAEDPDTAKRKLFDAFGSQGVSLQLSLPLSLHVSLRLIRNRIRIRNRKKKRELARPRLMLRFRILT
jgi:hypothetical protein